MAQVLVDHLAVIIIIAMIAVVALWHLWAFHLKPLAIPKAEIDAAVDKLIARHGPTRRRSSYAPHPALKISRVGL